MPELSAPFTLLTAARLLDGTGALPLDDAALLMEGRVVRVGPRREVRAPDGTPVRVVDYGDAAILPVLVDAHTHLVASGGREVASEDNATLLLQAAKNTRTLLRYQAGARLVRGVR